MPATQWLYTDAFVNGDEIDENKVNNRVALFLEYNKEKEKAKKWISKKFEKVEWNTLTKNVKEKLKRFDEGKGVEIFCKNSFELNKLILGGVKTLYLGGTRGNFDSSGKGKVQETINL